MTKVTIVGQAEASEPEKKKIEFVKVLLHDGTFSNDPMRPNQFTDIILLTRADGMGMYDIMYAYKDTYQNGCVYLGHFNDGAV